MCGIVGYIGTEEAAPILLEGLRRLEYRGYDSAGLAVLDPEQGLQVAKAKGRLQVLADLTGQGQKLTGHMGLGHTRWATHGAPNDVNSHPQVSQSGRIAVVHNGIIENYARLKEFLESKGIAFVSETDTEVVAQLLDYYYEGDLLDAVGKVLHRIEGAYALGIVCADEPDRLVAVRKDSPLILGYGANFHMLASDVTAVIQHTREVCYLEDGEVAVLTAHGAQVYNSLLQPRKRGAMSTLCSRRSWSSPRPCGTPFFPACGTGKWCWTRSPSPGRSWRGWTGCTSSPAAPPTMWGLRPNTPWSGCCASRWR